MSHSCSSGNRSPRVSPAPDSSIKCNVPALPFSCFFPLLCTPKTNPKPWSNWGADGTVVLSWATRRKEPKWVGALALGSGPPGDFSGAFIPEAPPSFEYLEDQFAIYEAPPAPRDRGPSTVAWVLRSRDPALAAHPHQLPAPHTPALGPTASRAQQCDGSPGHLRVWGTPLEFLSFFLSFKFNFIIYWNSIDFHYPLCSGSIATFDSVIHIHLSVLFYDSFSRWLITDC